MPVRVATVDDIEAMHRVRLAVRENVLRSASVTVRRYQEILERHGLGWVFEEAGEILGFAIADNSKRNVWALFVHPDHEGYGIGRELHETMMIWMFEKSSEPVWLVTDPSSRAAKFYQAAGWVRCGRCDNGETRFEMRAEWSPNKRMERTQNG